MPSMPISLKHGRADRYQEGDPMGTEEMALIKKYKLHLKDVKTIRDAQEWTYERWGIYDEHLALADIMAWLGEEIGELFKSYLNEKYPSIWWMNREGEEGIENEIVDVFHWCLTGVSRTGGDLEESLLKLEKIERGTSILEIQSKLEEKYGEKEFKQIIFHIGQLYGEACASYLKGEISNLSKKLVKIVSLCLIASNLLKVNLIEVWKARPVPGK